MPSGRSAACLHFLAERGGYDRIRDVAEGTYAGFIDPKGLWRPLPYAPGDTRRR